MVLSARHQCLIGLGGPDRLPRRAKDMEGYFRHVTEKRQLRGRVIAFAADGATAMTKAVLLAGVPRIVCAMHLANRAYSAAREVKLVSDLMNKARAAGVLFRSFRFVQFVRRGGSDDDGELGIAVELGAAPGVRGRGSGKAAKVATACVTRIIGDVFVLESLSRPGIADVQAFQRMRGGDGLPLTPRRYLPLDDEFLEAAELPLPALQGLRGLVSELERAFDSAETAECSGSIFCAMAHLMSVAIGTGTALENTGAFAEVGERLRSRIAPRLLKHETALRLLIRAMLLHPMLSVADLGSVHGAFASIAAEEHHLRPDSDR